MYAQSGYPLGSARSPAGGVASYASPSPIYTAGSTTTTYRTTAGGQHVGSSQVALGAAQPLSSRTVVQSAASSMGPGPTAVRTVLSSTSPGQQMAYAQGATVLRQAPASLAAGLQQQTYTRPAASQSTVMGARPPTVASGFATGTGAAPAVASTMYAQAPPTLVNAGPASTTTKLPEDPQLANLKELRRSCGLRYVPVGRALPNMKQSSVDGTFSREQFCSGFLQLLLDQGVEFPPESIQSAVFDLFDRDDNGIVDMMELICGLSMLCAGDQDEKIQAVFSVFDENGDGVISMDEMFKFLTSVFKVVLTGHVLRQMNTLGVAVESPEDLASVTALECFKTADLNQDGKLSIVEFKNWFYAPKNNSSFLFPSALAGSC